MKLSTEQVLAILKTYFSGEQWDDVSEDEDYLRLSLAERATGGTFSLEDGYFKLKTETQEA